MATSQNHKIRALVDQFVEQLSAEIRAEALAAVQAAFKSEGGEVPVPYRRGPGRPKATAGAKRGRKPGRPRKAGSISTDALLAAIKANEGERTEVIANGLGVSSKEFKPQLDELVEAGTVVRKGKARGTTLHLGKSGASPKRAKTTRKKAARKTSRKKAGRRKQASRRKSKVS